MSQKKDNHVKKWIPYLPNNLVMRIYNHGGDISYLNKLALKFTSRLLNNFGKKGISNI